MGIPATEVTESHAQASIDATKAHLRRLLLTWDGLRIPFTVLSVICAVALSWSRRGGTPSYGMLQLVCWTVVFGNLFYCIFPLSECYVFGIAGKRLGWVRYLLFALGLGIFIAYLWAGV